MATTICGDPKKRLQEFLEMKLATVAIHGAQKPDPVTGAVMPPIYQTSTYAQVSPGEPIGQFEYSRSHNPTRRALEDCLSLIEGGVYGFATSTGMNAITLVMSLLKKGEGVLCCDDVYGGTYRLFSKVLNNLGLDFKFMDFSDLNKVEESIEKTTRILWVETPTNPLLKIIDIEGCAKIAKKFGLILVVDNTFASPVFQRPIELGADIVMHSMTKYLNGHSDVVAGSLITRRDDLAERLYFNQNSMGSILPPFDSWLILRSLKTLPIRMAAHEKNAMELARWLEKHPKVERVIYPGLPSHPQHALAKKQMKGFSGMVSFYVKGGLSETISVLKSVKVFTLAESLGGVESLIEHPAIMTHASVPKEIRTANGIADNFIRLSVGIEDIDDLKADLDRAFV
jgi:cystathionine gamma-lyase